MNHAKRQPYTTMNEKHGCDTENVSLVARAYNEHSKPLDDMDQTSKLMWIKPLDDIKSVGCPIFHW